jgi:hypothetical protein
VERVASHAAFLAGGKLLLAAPLEDLRRRIVRIRLRFEGAAPDPSDLGNVLEWESSARQLQAVLQDPNRMALDGLRHREDVLDFEETPLSLEEIYTALMARFHRPGEDKPSANGRHGPRPGALASSRKKEEERP